MNLWSLIGLLLVLFIAWRFVKALGTSIPIMEMLLLIAALQWILGPYLSYFNNYTHYKYYMYVDENTYMSYAVPAFLFFSVIVLFQLPKLDINALQRAVKFAPFAKVLFVIGVSADIGYLYSPPSLLFFLFLLLQFKFVGAILFLFSEDKKSQYFFYGTLGYLFLNALARGLFHDLLLWGVFMFMFWSIKNRPSFRLRIAIITAGIFFAMGIQIIKGSYREIIYDGYKGNKLVLFLSVLEDKVVNEEITESDDQNVNIRLNQGWIISAIMYNVPFKEPFSDGGTIAEAVSASILPRFLDKNKKMAGGQENFERYTGLQLGSHTSMGMSLMGESYANFGVLGGIIFMGVWGLFLAWYWRGIVFFVRKYPLLLFFIPIIYLQVVKAETELVVVLNHLIKSSILIALFLLFASKVFNWRLR
ncbi:hypothetical protein K8352_17755 [Flavobacteriaceae bacterium F89]|uniref:Oligosaccharide repeat unit polymerase n=1 Tax=Cerina litoralis TaxID=2874477 RepID=A0AAE3EWX8_9FLAO|nr:hypothetical protein [Cerina litoralis]MCG2462612.1 hypothetical protein [Cerina litoralis]